MPQRAQRAAAVMQPDLVGELGPREVCHLQYVMEILDKFEGIGAEMAHPLGLLDRVEMRTEVVDATARGHDNCLEA